MSCCTKIMQRLISIHHYRKLLTAKKKKKKEAKMDSTLRPSPSLILSLSLLTYSREVTHASLVAFCS